MTVSQDRRSAVHVDPVRRLLDLHSIQELKARYCRFIDTKQWEPLAGLFAAETRFEGFGSAPTGADAATFVSGISSRYKEAITIHHCHMPEIAFSSCDEARGVWAMMDYVELAPGQFLKEAPGQRGFSGYGHYEDAYRKVDGNWKIAFTRLTRLRIDPMSPDAFARRETLLATSPDWLAVGHKL